MTILSITLPIYLLMLLGWWAARRALFSRDDLRLMGRFIVQIALPALLFKAVGSRPLSEVLHLGYLAAMTAGSLVVFTLVWLWARHAKGRDAAAAAIQAMGSSFSNTGYIGYPIALQFLGPVAGVALALNILVENLIMLPLVLALASRGSAAASWRTLFTPMLINPMIWAIVLGFALAASGLTLPAPLWKAVELMALASTGLALFVVGGSLAGLSTKGLAVQVGEIAFAKLLLHPLSVALALAWMPNVSPELRSAAILMAAMPMLGIYPIIAQRYQLEGPAAAALLGTTLLSFFSISGWLWWLQRGAGA
jgi:malonate transporter and related proteins